MLCAGETIPRSQCGLDPSALPCISFTVTLTFVETPLFSRQLIDCVGDEDYRAFQTALLRDPEQGDLLAGCRGLRKTRMALPGRGKSGGARVIYLYLPDHHLIYLFLLFKKSDAANLTKSQRNQLGDLARQIKASHDQKMQNS